MTSHSAKDSLVEPTSNSDFPLIISFYYGDEYYHKAAKQLADDCRKLGLDYEIIEAPLKKGTTWIQACRYKIRFIAQCLTKFKRPVLWVDVDGRLLAKPEILRNPSLDFAFFLHGFRYLKDYDPVALPRLLQPAILYFGNTTRAREFVKLMASIEATYKGEATDAYFIQEAWKQYEKPMSILLMPPDLVSEDLSKKTNAYFYIARSGNVSAFKDAAEQHEPDLYTPARRKTVLLREALDSTKAGKLDNTLLFLQRAFELDPTDESLANRVARLMNRQGKLNEAIEFLRKLKSTDNTDHANKFLLDVELEAGKPDRAEKIAQDLIASSNEADANWARSRLTRINLEKRAQEQNIAPEQRPELWWMEGPYPGNFGDILNPYVVEKLSGKPPRYAPAGKGILAIGSVIKFAKDDTEVWGPGTPRMSDKLNAKAKYHAVRGPLTRKLVIESGGKCPEVYGDPAWFLPLIYKPKPATKKYKLGLVLHYVNENDVTTSSDVKVIPVIRDGYKGIEQFIDELNQCDRILTTSLHGLIVSHAYGIPAQWCQITGTDTNLAGDGTKFDDYMLSVDIKPQPSLKIPKGTKITTDYASKVKQLPVRQIDLKALANAAPFQILPKWGLTKSKAVVEQPLTPAKSKKQLVKGFIKKFIKG